MAQTAAHRSLMLAACVLSGVLPAVADEPEPSRSILEYVAHLEQLHQTDSAGSTELARSLHRLRNAAAMAELVEALSPDDRPATILYLASGSHLAPLALCATLPEDAPCRLILTETDLRVRREIEATLDELEAARCLQQVTVHPLDTSADIVVWRFRLADRPVSLELRLRTSDTARLIEPEWLHEVDLVISHDWSGDPLVNLQVILEFMASARELGTSPPLLMIEDLRRHPYPIGLEVLGPEASTTLSYGHRSSADGGLGHGEVELGEPLFGGGVLLSFADGWWQAADQSSVEAILDLLVFSRFIYERQNVLGGGDDPLIAPALLDWYSGFGYRSVGGRSVRDRDDHLADLVQRASSAAAAMGPAARRQVACHLQLLRSALTALALDADIRSAMPSAAFTRRPQPGSYPNQTMESMYREAIRHAGDYRAAKRAERKMADRALVAFDEPSVRALLEQCPIDEPSSGEEPAEAWLDRYQALVERIESEQ